MSDSSPAPAPRPRRSPGGRDVLAIAALVLAIVFLVEVASRSIPGIGDAFAKLPITIIVLVGGTLLVLLRLLRTSRPR